MFTFSLHYETCITKQWLIQPIHFCSAVGKIRNDKIMHGTKLEEYEEKHAYRSYGR